jgi:hypothetical protein
MKYLALVALVAFLAVPFVMGCSEKPVPAPVKPAPSATATDGKTPSVPTPTAEKPVVTPTTEKKDTK